MSKEKRDLLVKQFGADKIKVATRIQLLQYKKKYPSMFFVPNEGQWRFFKQYDKSVHDKTPFIGAFLAGNGVGKTKSLVEFLIGCIWGRKFLNPNWLGKLSIWDTLPKKRSIRVVCKSDDIDEGGSLYQEILKSFPDGQWEWKKKGSAIKGIRVNVNGIMVSFRTHDQNIVAHAGSNEDIILFNEPCPENLWSENVGRTRNGGFIQLYMTPLKLSAWLFEQVVEDADGKEKIVVEASIWDNCKDIPGKRGVLPREAIERMIREWMLEDPDEADARINGTFGHLQGRVFKVFDHGTHVVEPFEIPHNWEYYIICDPHDVRPPAVQLWAVSPTDECYCVDEYPFGRDYTKMKVTDLTYKDLANDIMRQFGEATKRTRRQIMDPNKGNTKTRANNKTVQQEYNHEGFKFRLADNDDLDYGHKEIMKLLSFDRQAQVSDFNKPRMYFFETCRNTIQSISKYSYNNNMMRKGSLTQKIDDKYKDFVDCTRYFAVSKLPWRGNVGKNSSSGYAAIDKARGVNG